ncbi:methyltransferase type 12 [Pseudohongiella nitratireducens]|uniref:Methyltransferase type 12 n=1 Tax=Pseudohongiella nitratireducens TaxID=1768907 RepID=A0A916VJX4_9GAMM|nr:methyltransferase domain-containing protein [Pseudohongiella nitratireducens]GFZ83269.1 methyltransferase type 12 [Pseudohongiella nitratireducens]
MTEPRLCYQTIEFGDIDIHVCTLRDKQEFHDPDGVAEDLGISSATWPLFGVIWPSSLVLAHYIQDRGVGSKRVLEVGCGMALTSLLLNKQGADISATDYHPEVQAYMVRNTLLNNNPDIAFERVDWADTTDQLGKFDMIIGSDLLYEDEHTALLSDFILRHANDHCEVIIVDPGRGRKNKLGKRLAEAGFSYTQIKPASTDFLEQPFKGYILQFVRESNPA